MAEVRDNNYPFGIAPAGDVIDKFTHQTALLEFRESGKPIEVTSTSPLPTVHPESGLLDQILAELRTMNYHLNLITEGEE